MAADRYDIVMVKHHVKWAKESLEKIQQSDLPVGAAQYYQSIMRDLVLLENNVDQWLRATPNKDEKNG